MHLRTDTSSQSHFARVPTISRPRNAFSVAERHVTTLQFDYLYPIFHKFIYPGDTLSIEQRALSRLTTQVAVLYDDLYMDVHAWFVPFRLLQTNWARLQFNDQPTGPTQDNSSLTTPGIDLVTLGAGGFASKSLYDYFDYPTKIDGTSSIAHINNYLPRAYNLIWNSDYRDENLQNAVTVDLDDGPDDASNYVLLKRGKRHDMFTSGLTAQQKGTATPIPLGTSAPILTDTQIPTFSGGGLTDEGLKIQATSNFLYLDGAAATGAFLRFGDTSGLYADLANATGNSINNLRQSIAIQQLLEADARAGTRDIEAIQHRWGVTVPDFRLQRPEYCGGATFSFDGHVVPQTSETGTTPQGTLTQFSQALTRFQMTHSFQEHGVFMLLLSARANITYQQGLGRELTYRTRYDFVQPEFVNLGEVAVLNREIMFQGTSADSNTFNFQEYGYEMRYGRNRVSGEMRSNYTASRDNKHLADEYATLPTYGTAFIQSNTAISRNITVSAATADPIELNSFVQGRFVRQLPMYSVPGLWRL